MDRSHQPVEVFDVMEGERAVGEAEARFGQNQMLEVGDSILDRRILRLLPRACDHFLGEVEAKDLSRAVLPRPAGEPAEAAAEIQDAQVPEIGQHCADCGPFGSAGESMQGSPELTVAGEEFGSVVNVLCHFPSP